MLGGVPIHFKDFIFSHDLCEQIFKSPELLQTIINRELTDEERKIDGKPMIIEQAEPSPKKVFNKQPEQ